jgi:hypothetical protein
MKEQTDWIGQYGVPHVSYYLSFTTEARFLTQPVQTNFGVYASNHTDGAALNLIANMLTLCDKAKSHSKADIKKSLRQFVAADVTQTRIMKANNLKLTARDANRDGRFVRTGERLQITGGLWTRKLGNKEDSNCLLQEGGQLTVRSKYNDFAHVVYAPPKCDDNITGT